MHAHLKLSAVANVLFTVSDTSANINAIIDNLSPRQSKRNLTIFLNILTLSGTRNDGVHSGHGPSPLPDGPGLHLGNVPKRSGYTTRIIGRLGMEDLSEFRDWYGEVTVGWKMRWLG